MDRNSFIKRILLALLVLQAFVVAYSYNFMINFIIDIKKENSLHIAMIAAVVYVYIFFYLIQLKAVFSEHLLLLSICLVFKLVFACIVIILIIPALIIAKLSSPTPDYDLIALEVLALLDMIVIGVMGAVVNNLLTNLFNDLNLSPVSGKPQPYTCAV